MFVSGLGFFGFVGLFCWVFLVWFGFFCFNYLVLSLGCIWFKKTYQRLKLLTSYGWDSSNFHCRLYLYCGAVSHHGNCKEEKRRAEEMDKQCVPGSCLILRVKRSFLQEKLEELSPLCRWCYRVQFLNTSHALNCSDIQWWLRIVGILEKCGLFCDWNKQAEAKTCSECRACRSCPLVQHENIYYFMLFEVVITLWNNSMLFCFFLNVVSTLSETTDRRYSN